MEFIKDRWYKHADNYYKFDKLENNYYYFSEQIYNKVWKIGGLVVWVAGWRAFVEIQLDEIQDYLPIDHPDKLITVYNKEEDSSYIIKLFKK